VGFGRLLAVENNAVMADDILLPEHAEEKGVLSFIIEGGDSFGDVRE